MPSFLSQLGMSAGDSVLRHLEKVQQNKAMQHEVKRKRDTLSHFFPEEVSDLILHLPEKDQWNAIQQLAPSYANQQGGNADQGLQELRQGSELGPQGSQAIDQQLQQAMGRESNGLPLAQQVQQPAQSNEEFAQDQQPRQQRQTLGQALSPHSKEDTKAANEYVITERQKYKDSKGALNALSRMESYNNSGKLSYPLSSAFVNVVRAKGFGPDLISLLTPESQDYEKTATGFLKYAKQYFGSRMTEGELNTFLRTIPSLTNSKEGRKLLIESSKDLVRADQLMYKAMEDVIRDNGGRVPANIQQLAEQRAGPQLDKIYEKFRNPLIKQSIKSESGALKRLIEKHPPKERKVGQKYQAGGKTYTNTGSTYMVS